MTPATVSTPSTVTFNDSQKRRKKNPMTTLELAVSESPLFHLLRPFPGLLTTSCASTKVLSEQTPNTEAQPNTESGLWKRPPP